MLSVNQNRELKKRKLLQVAKNQYFLWDVTTQTETFGAQWLKYIAFLINKIREGNNFILPLEQFSLIFQVHRFEDETLADLQEQMKDMVKIGKDPKLVPKWLKVNKAMVPDFIVKDPKVSNYFCFLQLFITKCLYRIRTIHFWIDIFRNNKCGR